MRATRVRPEARQDTAAEFETELGEELQALDPRYGPEEVARWMGRHFPGVSRP